MRDTPTDTSVGLQAVLIPVANILVEDRLRSTDDDHPLAMAESIREQGLRQPITVRPSGEEGRYRLVIGAHRLRAFEILERAEIPAFVVEVSDLAARLMEIDENLCARRLEPLDRAVFLAERKRVYEELYPEARAGVAGGKARQGSANAIFAFAEDIQERIGLAPRTVQRSIQIHAGLDPDVRTRLQRHRHWKEGDLFALSKLPPKEQEEVLGRMEKATTNGALPDLSKALKTGSKPAADDGGLGKLLSAWERANSSARAAFLDHLRDEGTISGETGDA